MVFRFYATDSQKRSLFGKGYRLDSVSVVSIVIIPLFLLFLLLINLKRAFKEPQGIIALGLGIIMWISYILWSFYNSVPEIEIDENSLFIRKSRKFKRIPFAYINYVLISPSVTGVTSFKIKKNKNSPKLPLTYFTIPSGISKEKELLTSFLAELEKNVKLEHNTWQRYFKKGKR